MSDQNITNPFDRLRDPKRHDVAEMLLSKKTTAWTEILNKVGNFSPRTMGYVLRALEDQGATILRLRDSEYGTLYRYDPECPFEERYRLSKNDGPDAQRQRQTPEAPEVQTYGANSDTVGVR
jgi:DNA-binding transcriptional ArsR family regulator